MRKYINPSVSAKHTQTKDSVLKSMFEPGRKVKFIDPTHKNLTETSEEADKDIFNS